MRLAAVRSNNPTPNSFRLSKSSIHRSTAFLYEKAGSARRTESSPVQAGVVDGQGRHHPAVTLHVIIVALFLVVALDTVQDLVAQGTAVLHVQPLAQAHAVKEVAAAGYLRRSHFLRGSAARREGLVQFNEMQEAMGDRIVARKRRRYA